MALIETVKITNEGSQAGYKIINASDFDADNMTKFGAKKAATKTTTKKAAKT